MWRLYASESDGIAIKTDFSSFARSFIGDKNIFVGEVIYIDYETEAVDEQANDFALYLTKRKNFEHEAEVRAISLNIPMPDGDVDGSPHAAGAGVYHEVDIRLLIKEVLVAPYAEEVIGWTSERQRRVLGGCSVAKVAAKLRLGSRLRRLRRIQPESLLNAPPQVPRREWLGEVVVGSGGVALCDVGLLARGRHYDDRGVRRGSGENMPVRHQLGSASWRHSRS